MLRGRDECRAALYTPIRNTLLLKYVPLYFLPLLFLLDYKFYEGKENMYLVHSTPRAKKELST